MYLVLFPDDLPSFLCTAMLKHKLTVLDWEEFVEHTLRWSAYIRFQDHHLTHIDKKKPA